jgi:serine-type D-Ala-D-Ala carboxypeptidase (penicillin-binding protein 5/6)
VQRFYLPVTTLRCVFFSLFSFALVLPAARPLQAAQAWMIVDSQTGYVLEQQAPRDKRQVGSLTKVAAAMVVLDWSEKHSGDLNQLAAIPPEALVGTGENLIGFEPGDTITLRDLLYAALVQSDNVAAYALANHVGVRLQSIVPATPSSGGTPVGVFVGQMNTLAKILKMERTHFVNPHGIDDARSLPYSTASDMARLTRYAMNKAAFRFYVSQKERQISFNRGGKKLGYMLRNSNELLGRDGVDGVKTGKTARAGDCLILSAHRESQIVKEASGRTIVTPRQLIIVLLGSTNRFGEGAGLLARGWQLYDQWAATGRLVDPKKTL